MNVKAENVPCTKKEYTYILCTYSSSAIALAEERNAATTILHDSKNCSPFCCRFFFREKNRGRKRQDDK